jgi:peptidoglycan hydrolase FlgJ
MQVSPLSSLANSPIASMHKPGVHEKPGFAQLMNATATPDNAVPSAIDPSALESDDTAGVSEDLRKAFSDFVGQTFFSELIKSYRSTQQPAAYFDGGRAEKVFQGQLDQMFAEELSERSADKIAEPMLKQFRM